MEIFPKPYRFQRKGIKKNRINGRREGKEREEAVEPVEETRSSDMDTGQPYYLLRVEVIDASTKRNLEGATVMCRVEQGSAFRIFQLKQDGDAYRARVRREEIELSYHLDVPYVVYLTVRHPRMYDEELRDQGVYRKAYEMGAFRDAFSFEARVGTYVPTYRVAEDTLTDLAGRTVNTGGKPSYDDLIHQDGDTLRGPGGKWTDLEDPDQLVKALRENLDKDLKEAKERLERLLEDLKVYRQGLGDPECDVVCRTETIKIITKLVEETIPNQREKIKGLEKGVKELRNLAPMFKSVMNGSGQGEAFLSALADATGYVGWPLESCYVSHLRRNKSRVQAKLEQLWEAAVMADGNVETAVNQMEIAINDMKTMRISKSHANALLALKERIKRYTEVLPPEFDEVLESIDSNRRLMHSLHGELLKEAMYTPYAVRINGPTLFEMSESSVNQFSRGQMEATYADCYESIRDFDVWASKLKKLAPEYMKWVNILKKNIRQIEAWLEEQADEEEEADEDTGEGEEPGGDEEPGTGEDSGDTRNSEFGIKHVTVEGQQADFSGKTIELDRQSIVGRQVQIQGGVKLKVTGREGKIEAVEYSINDTGWVERNMRYDDPSRSLWTLSVLAPAKQDKINIRIRARDNYRQTTIPYPVNIRLKGEFPPEGEERPARFANVYVQDLPAKLKKIVLYEADLEGGEICVFGELQGDLGKIQKVEVSWNGGRSWSRIPIDNFINTSLRPQEGKSYELRLRYEDIEGKTWEASSNNRPEIVYKGRYSDEEALDVLRSLVEAYKRKSASGFMKHVSPDYRGSRSDLENGVLLDFERFKDIQIDYSLKNFIQMGKETYLQVKWQKTQTPVSDGSIQTTEGTTDLTFAAASELRLVLLRGDLLFATLSPEIAEESGKDSTTVAQIQEVKNSGGASQPGAGVSVAGGSVDLQTTDVHVYDAGSQEVTALTIGQTYTFGATIANNGSADATSFDVVISYEGGMVGDTITVSSLKAGSSTTVETTSGFTVVGVAGTREVEGHISTYNSDFTDGDSSNNDLTETFNAS